ELAQLPAPVHGGHLLTLTAADPGGPATRKSAVWSGRARRRTIDRGRIDFRSSGDSHARGRDGRDVRDREGDGAPAGGGRGRGDRHRSRRAEAGGDPRAGGRRGTGGRHRRGRRRRVLRPDRSRRPPGPRVQPGGRGLFAIKHARVTGSVTMISALSARAAIPGSAVLAAVNGAIERMVSPLASELAPLRVNAVSPGVIDTAWWSFLPD